MKNFYHNLNTNLPRMWRTLQEKSAVTGVYGIGVLTVKPASIIPSQVIPKTLEACLKPAIYWKYLLSLKAILITPVTMFPKITANNIVKNMSLFSYLLIPTLSTLSQGQARGKRELSTA